MIVVFLVLLAILLIWAILHTTNPTIFLEDITVYTFNISNLAGSLILSQCNNVDRHLLLQRQLEDRHLLQPTSGLLSSTPPLSLSPPTTASSSPSNAKILGPTPLPSRSMDRSDGKLKTSSQINYELRFSLSRFTCQQGQLFCAGFALGFMMQFFFLA